MPEEIQKNLLEEEREMITRIEELKVSLRDPKLHPRQRFVLEKDLRDLTFKLNQSYYKDTVAHRSGDRSITTRVNQRFI